MKTYSWAVVAAVLCLSVTGCRKSGGNGNQTESKVTGKPSDAPVDMTPKWSPGQRYVMRMESAQTMQMPNAMMGRGAAPGGTSRMENNFAQEYALTVTNAAETNRGVEMEILAIELQNVVGEQQQINYDSRNKVARDAGPMTESFDRVIGGRIHYLVSAENKVLKVEGLKELFERIEGPAEPGADPAQARRARMMAGAGAGLLRGMYNEEVLKQMIEFSAPPPHAVHIGESWPFSREVPSPTIGKMMLSMTNTLRGWQEHDGKKCARVEFAGTLSSVGEGTSGGALPMRMSLQGGSLTGHSWFSPDVGMTIETAVDQNYVLSVTGTFGRAPANAKEGGTENTFSLPVRQNVFIKLLEVKPAGP